MQSSMFAVCTRTKCSYSHASSREDRVAQTKNKTLQRTFREKDSKKKSLKLQRRLTSVLTKLLANSPTCLMNSNACVRKKQTVGNRKQGGSVWFETECYGGKKNQ